MMATVPRLMFAAAASGSGKTTVTCAVLKAFQNRGLKPAAFKCGPDFIDPMFHKKVLGAPSSNLDLFLMGATACKRVLSERAIGAGISLIEGVMGFYDGVGPTETYSSYHLASSTQTSVVLVVKVGGVAATIAAVLSGIASYRADSRVQGVILNGIREELYPFYKDIVEANTALTVYGYLPQMPECALESRHLGLITADEITGLQEKIDRLAVQAEKTINLDALRKLACAVSPIQYESQAPTKQYRTRIAVARDKAFCFYYEDSLAVLTKRGAEIVPFSPLCDSRLPECDGILLGGGYPELYARELSQNTAMRSSILEAFGRGMPCIAECGGFMYLHESLQDQSGQSYNMVGFVKAQAYMTDRLKRFGYVTLTAQTDNLLCRTGESIGAHEFHYSDSSDSGNAFVAQKPFGGRSYPCIMATPTLFAGYPHLHFAGNEPFAENFLAKCASRCL